MMLWEKKSYSLIIFFCPFFFSSRRRHTRSTRDWSSDVCSSDLNDVYMPTTACPFRSRPATVANRQARMVQVFGRMKSGMGVGQAQADLSGVAANLEKADRKSVV